MAANRRIRTRQVTANSNRVSASNNQDGDCQASAQQPPFHANGEQQRSRTPDGHQYISDIPGATTSSSSPPVGAVGADPLALPAVNNATLSMVNDTSGPLPRETSAGTLVVVGSPVRRGKELARMAVPSSTGHKTAPAAKSRKSGAAARKKNTTKSTTSAGSSSRILNPSDDDVLFGRGGYINKHPGNITFREIVSHHKDDYNKPTANKVDKNQISQHVVKQVKGKFLMKTECGGDWWEEVPDTKALSKTSQALREGAPMIRAKKAVTLSTAAPSQSKNMSRKKRKLSPQPKSHQPTARRKLDAPSRPEVPKVVHPTIRPLDHGRGKQLIRPPTDLTENVDDSHRPSNNGHLTDTLNVSSSKDEMASTSDIVNQGGQNLASTISDERIDDTIMPPVSASSEQVDDLVLDGLSGLDDDYLNNKPAEVSSSTPYAATSLGACISEDVSEKKCKTEDIVSIVNIPQTYLDTSSSSALQSDIKETTMEPRIAKTPDLLPQSAPNAKIDQLSLYSISDSAVARAFPLLDDEQSTIARNIPTGNGFSSRPGESTAANLAFPSSETERMHSIPYSSFDDDDHDFTDREPFSNPFPSELADYDSRSLDFPFSSDMDTQDETTSSNRNSRYEDSNAS